MSIGEKIKELRQKKGVSQYEMAEDLFMAQSSIGAWETNRNEPTIFNAILLADYFDVTLDELCGRCKK